MGCLPLFALWWRLAAVQRDSLRKANFTDNPIFFKGKGEKIQYFSGRNTVFAVFTQRVFQGKIEPYHVHEDCFE